MASLEYRVMVLCHEKLVAGIKTGVDPLADALFKNGMLSDNLRDEVQASLSHMTQEQKAREIVATLQTWIKDFGAEKYEIFMRILREKSSLFPQFGVLAGQLEDEMANLKTIQIEGESRSIPTYFSNESEQDEDSYIRFECACGECEIREFLDGKECPNLVSKGPPQLSMWTKGTSIRVPTQADMQWSEYTVQMRKQAASMNTKYKSLLSRTMNELKQRYTLHAARDKVRNLLNPQGAKKPLYCQMYNRDMKGRLRDVTTYEQLERYLDNNFCSWFNIDLLVNLRESEALLSYHTEDIAVTRYRESLEQYLKRLCFKCTVSNTSQGEYTEIVCKVSTDMEKVKKQQIDIFEHELCRYIQIPKCTRRIEDGSLILRLKQALPHLQSLEATPVTAPDAGRRATTSEGSDSGTCISSSIQSSTQGTDSQIAEERSMSQQDHFQIEDMESGEHQPRIGRYKRWKRALTSSTNRLVITLIMTIILKLTLIYLLGHYFLWNLPILYYYTALGSSTIHGGRTTELAHTLTTATLTEEDSLVFSQQPVKYARTAIYLTDCVPRPQSIKLKRNAQPGSDVLIDRRYLGAGSRYKVIFETKRTDCFAELNAFDEWPDVNGRSSPTNPKNALC